VLASVTAVDVAAGRVFEPHLDALAILSQADSGGPSGSPGAADGVWGVFAAEGAVMLLAESSPVPAPDPQPWCVPAVDRLLTFP
jgi:hypothetical protein